MMALPNGIAHVSYHGGGMFLPARTPYERQMLIEHVVDRARTRGQVQVLVDEQRWLVHAKRGRLSVCCERCSSAVEAACYSQGSGNDAYCVRCALGNIGFIAAPQRVPQQHVG